MTDLNLPAYMLAWKNSGEVDHMEEVPAGNSRRTVLGFQADNKFNQPAPKFSFDDPFEEEEDHLSKVAHYWKVRNQERTQHESRFCELLDAEEAAALRKRSEDPARELQKVQEEEALRVLEKTQEEERAKEKEKEKAKGKEKEKEKGKEKEKEAGSQREILSESEEGEGEEEDEVNSPQSCIYCMKKKIPWELANLEKRQEASRLEVVWHDLRMFLIEVEQKAAADSIVANTRVLQLLELKSKGVSVPEVVEKRIQAERSLVQQTLKENTEDLTERMDHIQKRTAWTNNGLYEFQEK
ncbi:hypothetical protein M422DRAFT_240503 [Sphaerobolus stellatus SS14]|nr:hypothetical protein M422DRAFT_240503 [Sphaerobolus stellatus SS14]